MTTEEIVSGQEQAWTLLKKLGEGDAGEVYLVESLLEKKQAILKRPHRSAFTNEMLRQASQIDRESRVLRALSCLEEPTECLYVPKLLDHSKAGVHDTEHFFIIITPAPGFDLIFLARCARFGYVHPQIAGIELTVTEQVYLERIYQKGKLPELIVLRALLSLITFLEKVHSFDTSGPSGRSYGIIWNDVKPEHFFWEPNNSCLTIIDWGNALFLTGDGTTEDRQHSRLDDYQQLLSEMGAFLASETPDLYTRLEWPLEVPPASAYTMGVLPLKNRLSILLQNELKDLHHVRQQERELVQIPEPGYKHFVQLDQVHARIVSYGELPDYSAAGQWIHRLAHSLVDSKQLPTLSQICQQAGKYPALEPTKWHLIEQISNLSSQQESLLSAIPAALDNDWPACFWRLRVAIKGPEPAWWGELSSQIRRLYLQLSPDALTPLVALNRLAHTLQSTSQLDKNPNETSAAITDAGQSKSDAWRERYEVLHRALKEQVLPGWLQEDPDPPDADLEYRELDRYLERIYELAPQAGQILTDSLQQPRAQVNIVLDAWERQDFETARRGLRNLLIWDPDRRRVITADLAIQRIPDWLKEIETGPKDETRLDFITRLELAGREFRYQVGPASWLDAILEAFKGLRKDTKPTDVLLQFPQLRNLLGWLFEAEPSHPLLAFPERPVKLERQPAPEFPRPYLRGVIETALGEDQDLFLSRPADSWAPEARGSSARVFQGMLRDQDGNLQEAAIKIMRPDRVEYALPLFEEEIQILQLLHDVPGITPLLECGFIRLFSGQALPSEESHAPANDLTGRVLRYGPDAVRKFLAELQSRTEYGWLPYLAMTKRDPGNNLLLMCDASYTRGRFLPILNALVMAIQICDILEIAHRRRIVYRDHKILHYYWNEDYNGIFMIDWNIARVHHSDLPVSEIQFDLVQFGARALHHILTGRPAPGALPLGPNRPEDIEAASHSYNVQWTYDDQRLPQALKDILQRSLTGEYTTAADLRADLHQVFEKLAVLLQS